MPKIGPGKTDHKGNFKIEWGYTRVEKDNGDVEYIQPRFYLGKERGPAGIRYYQIETIWSNIGKEWQVGSTRQGPRPAWTTETLAIAKAVGQGQAAIRLPLAKEIANKYPSPEDLKLLAAEAMNLLAYYRRVAPMIQIDWEDEKLQAEGEGIYQEAAQQILSSGQKAVEAGQRMLNVAEGKPSQANGQTLHQAFDAYATHVVASQPSPTTGKKQADETRLLKEHAKDLPLCEFDLAAVEGLITYWQNRPLTKRGQPFAVATVKDLIKRFRNFLRWLHKAKAFTWRKPEDYEVLPIRVPLSHAERASRLNVDQVETYTLAELQTLYEYATPIERIWLLLALNTGFGNAEVAALQNGEIYFNYTHPKFKGLAGDFIRMIRPKTLVYGEFILWPETVAGLRWYQANRPESQETTFFLANSGRPYATPTESNNPNRQLFNAWFKLCKRIRKDFPAFRQLSFNKLRKTAASLIRDIAGGEIAGVFLFHGQPVETDELAELYANKPFDKVHAAILKAHETLAPMFAKVENPFPDGNKKVKPSISLGTIKKIKEMRKQGFKAEKVAEELGVSVRTVRMYANGK